MPPNTNKTENVDAMMESMSSRSGTDLVLDRYFADAQKTLLPELQKLDLSINESKILVYLMIRKYSTATDISKYTGVGRTETYHYLSNLLAKGVVLSTFDRPQKYYALPYREAVDCMIQAKQNTLRVVSENKEEYEDIINKIVDQMVVPEDADKESYQVVIGEDSIYAKIKRMLADVREEAILLVSEKNFINLYHAEITDVLQELAGKGVRVKIQTPCKTASEYMNESGGGKHNSLSIKIIPSDDIPVSFVLLDKKEVILLLENKSAGVNKKQEPCGFYTNNQSMVTVFKFLYDRVV